MNKSIIINNIPIGAYFCDLQRIAKHFGLTAIPGHYTIASIRKEGFLYPIWRKYVPTAIREFNIQIIDFLDAAKEVNAAIPLTDWATGRPPFVGEWNASYRKEERSRRWWNGRCWSVTYHDSMKEESKGRLRMLKPVTRNNDIEWRGLSQQPITAGFAK